MIAEIWNNDDFLLYLGGLRGLAPSDQVIAMRLAEQADEHLEVRAVDWERLANDTGLSNTTLRLRLRPGSPLIDEGYIVAEPRSEGKVILPTIYLINVMRGG